MKTRWMEHALLVVGLVAMDVWIWSNACNVLYQGWESWVFDHEIHHRPATVTQLLAESEQQLSERVKFWLGLTSTTKPPIPGRMLPEVSPPSIQDKALVGRLTIPRLHLSAIVLEGAGEETLSLALGHIPHTALPGQAGNVGVAGHRDRLFRCLRHIRRDDLIVFETLGGKYVYQVNSTSVVRPEDISVLHPGPKPELTLVTCYPFYYVGSAPERFIVKALQMPRSPPALAAKL